MCGWPTSNFDAPLILNHFPNIKILRIENSDDLTYIDKDFPELLYLEVIIDASGQTRVFFCLRKKVSTQKVAT